MITVISEDQLEDIEIKSYLDVVAVKPGERDGVSIWQAKVMAQFVAPNAEAPLNEQRVLLIEVPDPNDQEVINRLRVACTDSWSKRRAPSAG